MIKAQMRQAWLIWKDTGTAFTMEMSSTMIMEEEKGIEANELQISNIKKQRKALADKSSRQAVTLTADMDRLQDHRTKTIANMIDRNQTHFFTSKLNHIFHGWKAYMDRRRKCCQILTTSLYKTATKKTFDQINAFARESHHNVQKDKGSNKLFRLYFKYRCKAALTAWRE